MKPIVLRGVRALSDFRLSALIQSAAEISGAAVPATIEADFVYFVHTAGQSLTDDVREKTYALLGALAPHQPHDGFYVTPRKGTISPWSSKATDIFHNCGLSDIIRVERGVHYRLLDDAGKSIPLSSAESLFPILHDRMTEGVYTDVTDMFEHQQPAPLKTVDILAGGRAALEQANVDIGLALNDDEIGYLYDSYVRMGRNPTDVELVMFGQVNSEHCRHKIFKADWIVDGDRKRIGLFDMIRNTHKCNSVGTLSAYTDNSAVIEGVPGEWFEIAPEGDHAYGYHADQIDMMIKVETHNHPTAISPFPGAATGVGGEIRDEGATGTGGRSKAGLCGYMVSNLNIPGFSMPWERTSLEFPRRLATALEIMTEGPIGGAGFGNEYGRPQLCGFFKTYEEVYNGRFRGYHKPIMLAGGMGNIKRGHVHKNDIPVGSYVLQIGGPAMRIGLGGGAASSMDTGSNAENLDFDSVQRDNAEMERRCQEVISACIALSERNPILSIHDIGAGGLSNGCPELVEDVGAVFQLREIHNEEVSMSPMEIWCCEAQERYVLAVAHDDLDRFLELCKRERCEVAVIGETTGDHKLVVEDPHFDNQPIDLDLDVLFGNPPKMLRDVQRLQETHAPLDLSAIELPEAAKRVLQLPAVANKTFLISIADRSITGLVARDQMVGPYQTPIADCAVTSTGFKSTTGEAMAVGERSRVAVIDAAASGRLAVAEALLNIASANIGAIGQIKLSANWMAACNEEGEDANLFDAVEAVGMDLCPKLGLCIPVGKDSLSMRSVWQDGAGDDHRQVAPLSLCVTAFAPVRDVRKTVTPDLKPLPDSTLILLDIGRNRNRLGGASALAQVYNQVGSDNPDLDDPQDLLNVFNAVQCLVENELLLAYHDRSDGGLFTTLAEMCFGGRQGISCDIAKLGDNALPALFSEELGAVIQVADDKLDTVRAVFADHQVFDLAVELGKPADDRMLTITAAGTPVYSERVSVLNRHWSETSFHMQALRDNPECAQEEFDGLLDEDNPGMNFHLAFDPTAPFVCGSTRPRMAILREQGINGQVEMGAAFDRAGFESIDVHMTDLIEARVDLADFAGLVACGGFSYGDVLGAGSGWAKSILFNPRLKDMFAAFFARPETFALGVCNGCQMISQLKEIIPGAEHWPAFTRNRSEQFEARYVTAEILESPSIFFRGMEGSRLGIPVAHGEGFANFAQTGSLDDTLAGNLLSVRYVDNYGRPAQTYPLNPNGSPEGITGVTTRDGRVTVMMPHPERGFRNSMLSYHPADWTDDEGPWLRMFQNARTFVG
ncbi:MAG: phosphoribosylformylglycinamidine synthase [Lentisphaeria bacterium]|nr:phosphoribosylformylglycinamidine synthase [Lentisphaeria bacterium]